ncbi:MAG: NAD(P)/FAD-dependent oxidoreductase [Elusimicrobia bacterium]|nr:NAD(P)/FAD-dependent oxidoreductase [Elusimicrobiota bacterium]
MKFRKAPHDGEFTKRVVRRRAGCFSRHSVQWMSMKNIAIIGAGIGGLTAGNLLAAKGYNVAIFEARNVPGGYISGFSREGFYFEGGTLSFESSGSIFKVMRDIGVFDKLQFIKIKPRFVSQKYDKVVESYAGCRKMIFDAYPEENKELGKYFHAVDGMYEAMKRLNAPSPLLFSGFQRWRKMVPFMFNAFRAAGIFKEYKNTTIESFTERFFSRDSELFSVLSNIMYPGMGAWIIGGALHAICEDYWTVRGGMQEWADVLAGRFTELGGKLKLNSRVDGIITENNRVAGVKANGVEYPSDVVISACDYKNTLLKLLDHPDLVEQSERERIEKAQVSEGVFTVYLGLKMPNDELAKALKTAHVYLNPDISKGGKRADIEDTNDEDFFAKTALTLFSPSVMNSGLAPAGRSSLMIQTLASYGWMNNWGGGDKSKYRKLKENAGSALIKRGSSLVPGLKESICLADTASPLTYEKFTGNTRGATSSWSWNPHKRFYKNGFNIHIETPVKNLLIGSCWASQIGGVPGAVIAAHLCAEKTHGIHCNSDDTPA